MILLLTSFVPEATHDLASCECLHSPVTPRAEGKEKTPKVLPSDRHSEWG